MEPVAGPGTGKTYNFKQALSKAILDSGTAEKGLALTFIRNLVADLAEALSDVADVFTFHGFGPASSKSAGYLLAAAPLEIWSGEARGCELFETSAIETLELHETFKDWFDIGNAVDPRL